MLAEYCNAMRFNIPTLSVKQIQSSSVQNYDTLIHTDVIKSLQISQDVKSLYVQAADQPGSAPEVCVSADCNLGEGSSGRDIIQKNSEWAPMTNHGLKIGQIFAYC